ncbi:type III secretion system inner rod subunit SctI [Kalamiella sp. sgz302252]|uniref:type III secretion system inner rod subunit SctI n=1 Tax=Pantoea sp. sgz302252 TaxID=3341827 RepID=UPI0036D35F16
MSMLIDPLDATDYSGSSLSLPEHSVVSLEDRMLQAYAESYMTTQAEQIDVIDALQKRRTTSDPAELFKLQQRTSDYSLYVTTLSILAKKGVSTVETLLRS